MSYENVMRKIVVYITYLSTVVLSFFRYRSRIADRRVENARKESTIGITIQSKRNHTLALRTSKYHSMSHNPMVISITRRKTLNSDR